MAEDYLLQYARLSCAIVRCAIVRSAIETCHRIYTTVCGLSGGHSKVYGINLETSRGVAHLSLDSSIAKTTSIYRASFLRSIVDCVIKAMAVLVLLYQIFRPKGPLNSAQCLGPTRIASSRALCMPRLIYYLGSCYIQTMSQIPPLLSTSFQPSILRSKH